MGEKPEETPEEMFRRVSQLVQQDLGIATASSSALECISQSLYSGAGSDFPHPPLTSAKEFEATFWKTHEIIQSPRFWERVSSLHAGCGGALNSSCNALVAFPIDSNAHPTRETRAWSSTSHPAGLTA